MLNEAERRQLVDLARRSVEARVSGRRGAAPPDPVSTPASGVFVTVKVSGELRGCLGTLECRDLATDVVRCAADAASEDPRFAPVASHELTALTVEVSILGPLERIDPLEPESIVVGRDGLVVEDGHQRGLLLPQVAAERHWTREQFLRQTCVKAGLRTEAWRHGAAVYRFSAEVFGE